MANLILDQFKFGSARSPKVGSMRQFGLWKTIGIVSALWAALAIVSPAQTFKTLASFDGTNGATPYSGLVQATDGNFWGTTYNGGTSSNCVPSGCGTAFKITPEGKLITLHRFCSQTNCADGTLPYAGLVQATDGQFYGTTQQGGNDACSGGCGTVFRVTRGGRLTTLHSFDGTDGYSPNAGLLQATDGNFYGTTTQRGTITSGTVFKITPKGELTTLYNFCSKTNCTDGADPWGGLVQGTDGNFYGTTAEGGAYICRTQGRNKIGCGTVFKITAKGKLTTIYNFCSKTNCTDGSDALAGLVQAADGNFYGTTAEGGVNTSGTVFKITPKGKLATLYSFCSQTNCTDGATPYAGLMQATDGNLYGTTRFGGANNSGAVFKINPEGKLTILHSFCSQTNCTDGEFPQAGPMQATNGKFYGTTSGGGGNMSGTVFSLSVGLGPFLETRPTSGEVGTTVIILGTNLTGATSVTFDGAPAEFKVISSSEVTAEVPNGATTGKVKVKMPGGTVASNLVFRVTK
jgi:uncharacterized repeat protein (TIGR03803 family)